MDPIDPLLVAATLADSVPAVRSEYSKYDGSHWYVATTFGRTFYEEEAYNGFIITGIDTSGNGVEHVGQYVDQTSFEGFVFTEAFSDHNNGEAAAGFVGDKKLGAAFQLKPDVEAFLPSESQPLNPSILTMPEQFKVLRGYPAEVNTGPGRVDPKVMLKGLFLVGGDNKTESVATVSQVSSDDTMIQVIDVNDPIAPKMTWSMTIEGALKDSQQVGNTLFLITERR